MKNSNVPLIRTRLHRKGVTGLSADEIKTALDNNNDDIDATVSELFSKHQTAIATTESDSGVSPESEEDFKSLLKINNNDDETVAMIKSEAGSMGLTIPVNHINDIATSVKQSRTYQSDKLKAIKSALIAYIDWQHEQSSNEAVETIKEVKEHATNKAVEFNNKMVGELSEFFRQSEQNSAEFADELIKALSVG